MNIVCTKKLEKYLGKNLSEATPKEAPLLGNWNAHLFTHKRKNWVIAMHSATYYPVLLMGIKKTDLPKFQLLFYNRLMEQLIYDDIKVIDPMQTLLLKDSTPNCVQRKYKPYIC